MSGNYFRQSNRSRYFLLFSTLLAFTALTPVGIVAVNRSPSSYCTENSERTWLGYFAGATCFLPQKPRHNAEIWKARREVRFAESRLTLARNNLAAATQLPRTHINNLEHLFTELSTHHEAFLQALAEEHALIDSLDLSATEIDELQAQIYAQDANLMQILGLTSPQVSTREIKPQFREPAPEVQAQVQVQVQTSQTTDRNSARARYFARRQERASEARAHMERPNQQDAQTMARPQNERRRRRL